MAEIHEWEIETLEEEIKTMSDRYRALFDYVNEKDPLLLSAFLKEEINKEDLK